MVVGFIVFLSSANLICRSTDISKCFIESLGVRDNESRLYLNMCVFVMHPKRSDQGLHCSLTVALATEEYINSQ